MLICATIHINHRLYRKNPYENIYQEYIEIFQSKMLSIVKIQLQYICIRAKDHSRFSRFAYAPKRRIFAF